MINHDGPIESMELEKSSISIFFLDVPAHGADLINLPIFQFFFPTTRKNILPGGGFLKG